MFKKNFFTIFLLSICAQISPKEEPEELSWEINAALHDFELMRRQFENKENLWDYQKFKEDDTTNNALVINKVFKEWGKTKKAKLFPVLIHRFYRNDNIKWQVIKHFADQEIKLLTDQDMRRLNLVVLHKLGKLNPDIDYNASIERYIHNLQERFSVLIGIVELDLKKWDERTLGSKEQLERFVSSTCERSSFRNNFCLLLILLALAISGYVTIPSFFAQQTYLIKN